MSKNEAIAKEILDVSTKLGWDVLVRGDILTIVKNFTPGDMSAFVKADGEYYSILGLLPRPRPGSMWGTDGGGVGAVAAHRDGRFVMNVSGGNKLVLRKLEKLL